MNKRVYSIIGFILIVFLLGACTADITPATQAAESVVETPAYALNVHRNFGYGGGDEIKGNFGMAITGDQSEVDFVTYLIDGETMEVVNTPPFELIFETTDFPYGQHDLSAKITLIDGSEVETGVRTFIFATAEQEQAAVKEITIPLLTAVLVAAFLGIFIQMLITRKKGRTPVEPGTPRDYGISGGAVCPKCQRPFALHVFSPHLLIYKFERCENCGRWVLVRRATAEELRAAEQEEIRNAKAAIPHEDQVEEKKEKDKIDDSKYMN